MAIRFRVPARAVGARPLALAPFPIWPYVPWTQHYAAPLVSRPQEWYAPACTVANVTTFTATLAEPLFVPALAVIVAEPAAAPVTTPDASTVATVDASLVHMTVGPTRRLPLESISTARSCAVAPRTIDGVGGDTATDAIAPPPRTAAQPPSPDGQLAAPLIRCSAGVPAASAEYEQPPTEKLTDTPPEAV